MTEIDPKEFKRVVRKVLREISGKLDDPRCVVNNLHISKYPDGAQEVKISIRDTRVKPVTENDIKNFTHL
jgi:hypothetical protein